MSVERCDDVNQLHPKVKELAEKLLFEARRQGLNIRVIDTYRSKERQDYLYAQGRTRPGAIVTNARGSDMSSYHNWRLAFDCINNQKGDEYNSTVLAKLGKIGQTLGLEWGGGWSSFKDAPHFQYTFGLSIKDLKAGKKPPVYLQKDEQLEKAVEKLVIKGIIGNPSTWNSKDRIKLTNVPALLVKMGGVNKLIANRVISNGILWVNGNYTVDHVRSLIIKYAAIV